MKTLDNVPPVYKLESELTWSTLDWKEIKHCLVCACSAKVDVSAFTFLCLVTICIILLTLILVWLLKICYSCSQHHVPIMVIVLLLLWEMKNILSKPSSLMKPSKNISGRSNLQCFKFVSMLNKEAKRVFAPLTVSQCQLMSRQIAPIYTLNKITMR